MNNRNHHIRFLIAYKVEDSFSIFRKTSTLFLRITSLLKCAYTRMGVYNSDMRMPFNRGRSLIDCSARMLMQFVASMIFSNAF